MSNWYYTPGWYYGYKKSEKVGVYLVQGSSWGDACRKLGRVLSKKTTRGRIPAYHEVDLVTSDLLPEVQNIVDGSRKFYTQISKDVYFLPQ